MTVRFGRLFQATDAKVGFCPSGAQADLVGRLHPAPSWAGLRQSAFGHAVPVDGWINVGDWNSDQTLLRLRNMSLLEGRLGACRSCRWGTQQVQRYIGLWPESMIDPNHRQGRSSAAPSPRSGLPKLVPLWKTLALAHDGKGEHHQ